MISEDALGAATRALRTIDIREGRGDYALHEYIPDAIAILEAAAPHIHSRAWDEGHEEGWLNATDGITEPTGRKRNPYRKADAHGND